MNEYENIYNWNGYDRDARTISKLSYIKLNNYEEFYKYSFL